MTAMPKIESSPIHYSEIIRLFPEMSEEERLALKEDIRINGVLDPVTLWQGELIDGRNRWEICEELNISCPTQSFEGTYDEAVAYAMSKNFARRHLDSSQRAALLVETGLIQWEDVGEADGDEKKSRSKGRSDEKIAKAAGTNRQYLHDALAIKEADPEMFERVKSGEIKIHKAMKQVKKNQGEDQPKEEKGESGGAGQRDQLGLVVPESLVEVFVAATGFDETAKLVRELEKKFRIVAADKAGELLEGDMQAVKAALETLKGSLKLHRPHTTCPHCSGKGDGCDHCRRRGWVTQNVYRSAPEELKAKHVQGVAEF